MYKVIGTEGNFRIKELDEKGSSVRVLDEVYKTEGRALDALDKIVEAEAKKPSAPEESKPEAAPEAPVSAPTAPANDPQTDNPEARGAVDEGQSPAAPEATPGDAAPQA